MWALYTAQCTVYTLTSIVDNLAYSQILPSYFTLRYCMLLKEATQRIHLMLFLFICETSNDDSTKCSWSWNFFQEFWVVMTCFFTAVPTVPIKALHRMSEDISLFNLYPCTPPTLCYSTIFLLMSQNSTVTHIKFIEAYLSLIYHHKESFTCRNKRSRIIVSQINAWFYALKSVKLLWHVWEF